MLAEAAHQVTALHPASNPFSPALSLVVLLAWPALTLPVAALTITGRDAEHHSSFGMQEISFSAERRWFYPRASQHDPGQRDRLTRVLSATNWQLRDSPGRNRLQPH